MPLLAAFALAMPAGAALAPPAVAATQAQAAALGQRVLRAGSTGNDVRRLQALLTRTGLKVGQDGEFGPATAKAVQTFQSVTGLGVTGVVDATTARYLITATSGGRTAQAANNGGVNRATFTVKTKALGDRLPVRRGMSGRDVKMLQDFLRRAGVRRVTVDGEFGGGTLRAVRTWEGSVRRKIDGVVDAGDVARLREQVGAVRGKASTAATPAPAAPAAPTLAPGARATINANGTANAPAGAPDVVRRMIAAGNQIATKPYVYGGGHRADWKLDSGYDCSGSVSWALHGAGLLSSPMPSGNFMNWGAAGPGQWVTIFAHSGHMYAIIAGLRFDTSGRSTAGTRWQTSLRDSSGFAVRHPEGL